MAIVVVMCVVSMYMVARVAIVKKWCSKVAGVPTAPAAAVAFSGCEIVKMLIWRYLLQYFIYFRLRIHASMRVFPRENSRC